jgi:hypothetical protein
MRALTAILIASSLTGCANLNGWEHGGRLLEAGPIVYQMPQSAPNGVADIRTGTTTYNLPGGSFQANTVGNSVTVIQTSKSR